MKQKIFIVILIGTIVGIGVGVYLYQKPSDLVVTEDSAYEVDAAVIFDEFNQDEPRANQKYLNKVITVTGKITDVSVMDSLGINVMLATANPIFGVSCQVPAGAKQRSLKTGDQVEIKGLCTGKLMDVVLIKCSVAEKNRKSI